MPSANFDDVPRHMRYGVSAHTFTAITPHDSTNFTGGQCDAIYVGGAGNMVVVDSAGTATTISGVLAGTIYPLSAIRVNSTSTTATNLVALYY